MNTRLAILHSLSRRSRWCLFLLLSGALACGSAESMDIDPETIPDDSTATTITVEMPTDSTESLEYSIRCLESENQTKIGQTDTSPGEVVAEGVFEPAGVGGDLQQPTTVWRALVDLPPGSCFIDLRARNGNGELVCTATESVFVASDAPTERYVSMACPLGEAYLTVHTPEASETAGAESVAYVLRCAGNGDTFLDNLTAPRPVTIDGLLDFDRSRTMDFGGGPVPTDVWRQRFEDLPPGPCLVELSALDVADQPICTAKYPFVTIANEVAWLYAVVVCTN